MENTMTYKEVGGDRTAQKQIAPEFATWPSEGPTRESIDEVRVQFDQLLDAVSLRVPPENGRYLALVKTKLEEACMFAVKAIAKR